MDAAAERSFASALPADADGVDFAVTRHGTGIEFEAHIRHRIARHWEGRGENTSERRLDGCRSAPDHLPQAGVRVANGNLRDRARTEGFVNRNGVDRGRRYKAQLNILARRIRKRSGPGIGAVAIQWEGIGLTQSLLGAPGSVRHWNISRAEIQHLAGPAQSGLGSEFYAIESLWTGHCGRINELILTR